VNPSGFISSVQIWKGELLSDSDSDSSSDSTKS